MREGENRVRNFILELDSQSAIHRMCRDYHLNVNELCMACLEILQVFQGIESPASGPLDDFSDPERFEALLQRLNRATHGQAPLPRRTALADCAREYALRTHAPQRRRSSEETQGAKLKTGIFNQLFLLLLLAGLGIVGLVLLVTSR